MATKAHGRILFWEGASMWIFRAPPGERYPKTDPHAHHVLQVTLALTGQIAIDGESARIERDSGDGRVGRDDGKRRVGRDDGKRRVEGDDGEGRIGRDDGEGRVQGDDGEGRIGRDDGEGRVEGDGDARWDSGGAIAIAPSALHAFEGTGLIAHLFIASDGKAGRQIARGLFSRAPITAIPARELGGLPARLKATFEDPRHTDDDLRAVGRSLIARLASEGVRPDAPDPRIVGLLAWVAPRLVDPISLDDAASVDGHLDPQIFGPRVVTPEVWQGGAEVRLGEAAG